MGIGEILKDKEEFIGSLLKILEGKEAKTTFNFKDVEFHVGKSKVTMNGSLDVVFVPLEKQKK